jgi:hypothetical protein
LNLAPLSGGAITALCRDCGRPADWTSTDDALVIVQPPYTQQSIGMIRLADRRIDTI